MPQSFVQVYLHIVFSTKHRYPLILPQFEKELHQFIEDKCNQWGCIVLEVGGSFDHIHILCRQSKHISIPKLLEKVKGSSSKWMKTRSNILKNFYWQNGYAAFSVSPDQVDKVSRYIQNQHIHHLSTSFRSEFTQLLDKLNVEYNAQYLWEEDGDIIYVG